LAFAFGVVSCRGLSQYGLLHFGQITGLFAGSLGTHVCSQRALQNAVETANMIGKQAVAHRDIAINNEWENEVRQGAGDAEVLRALAVVLSASPDTLAATVSRVAGNK
jgi:hypothetical protein